MNPGPILHTRKYSKAGDMNTLMMPPAYCLSNVEIVGSFLYVFQSSVLFSAVRARPLKKLCLLVWLKTDLLKFIELWKPGLAESIYNYRPCSRWGLAPQPSTKGSPRFPAPGWPVPKELQRNSQRCIKLTCHVKANSNNLLLNILPPIAKHKVQRSVPQIGDTQI